VTVEAIVEHPCFQGSLRLVILRVVRKRWNAEVHRGFLPLVLRLERLAQRRRPGILQEVLGLVRILDEVEDLGPLVMAWILDELGGFGSYRGDGRGGEAALVEV